MITAIILGIGLSMDAFAVSITNGMCGGRLKPRHALIDGLTFGVFQAAMPLIGLFLGMSFMNISLPLIIGSALSFWRASAEI